MSEPVAEPVDLLVGLGTTRSIRRYTDDVVSDEELSTILWAGSRAPSGSNRQPFRFLVLREGSEADEAKSILGRSFRAGWEAKRRSDGYDSGSGDDPTSPKSRQRRAMQEYVDRFERIPVVPGESADLHRRHPTRARSHLRIPGQVPKRRWAVWVRSARLARSEIRLVRWRDRRNRRSQGDDTEGEIPALMRIPEPSP